MDAELLRIGVGGVVPVRWEAEKSDADPGTLTGWASVYNVVDQQDEVVVPGAFRKTIDEWRAKRPQRVIPLTSGHENNADGVIGSLTKASDTPYGLHTTFMFSSTTRAQEARIKAREGHLNGLSIFGPIFQYGFDRVAGREVRLLKEVGLMAVALTPLPANADSLVLTAKESVSDKPWGRFTAADYTPEQYRQACLVDTGEGEVDSKERYKLPVREPSGVLNRAGCHAAAASLAGARGGVQISAEQKSAAARKLVSLYRNQLKEDPPDSLRQLAGTASASLLLPDDWVSDMRSALSITVPVAQKAAVDLLVEARYRLATEPEPEPQLDGDIANEQSGDLDDAAAYALSIIGESGPDTSPPGGEPSDSLAGLFASLGAEETKSELERLEAELRSES